MFKTKQVVTTEVNLPPPDKLTLTWNRIISFKDYRTIDVGGHQYEIVEEEYSSSPPWEIPQRQYTEVKLELLKEVV